MKNLRTFRPSISDVQLEDRVVMSTVPAGLFAPAVLPHVTTVQVNRALNQIHNALLSFQASVTNATLYTQHQVNAGVVSAATGSQLLENYVSNKAQLLAFQTRSASANLPYGAGFNGYVNPTNTSFGDLPSGADSLFARLTYPNLTTNTGPIAQLPLNVFTALSTQNFQGALAAVNSNAIHSTYASVKSVVAAYVANGIRAHDFR